MKHEISLNFTSNSLSFQTSPRRVMTSIVFNSVPMEDIDQTWGSNPSHDRVQAVIREIRRYGVENVFEPEDLIEMRNIPKVTKCLAQLSKLVRARFRILKSRVNFFSFIISGCCGQRQPLGQLKWIAFESMTISGDCYHHFYT